MVEWSIVAFLAVAMLGALSRQLVIVHGKAEYAAAQYTLGALRTSMVLAHLRRVVRNETTAPNQPPQNPFELLERLPENFVGSVAITNAHTVAPGNWFFDPQCGCVAYRIVYPQWLTEPEGTEIVAFRVERLGNISTLVPIHTYVWHGEKLT